MACIKRWPITSLHPFGTLTEELGDMGDLEVETEALLRDNNFSNEPFSETLTRLVDSEVKIEESEGRRDFTAEKVFSIDPLSAKDLDDAVHITTREDGVIEVGVHIADVTHYVKYNSPVDREAKKRGAGVYLVQRSVPMLPPHLTEKLASLVPGEERRSVSLLFESKDDDLVCTWIGKGKIRSTAALTYDDVQAFFDGKSVNVQGLEEQLNLLNIITEKIRNQRFEAGSLSFGSLRLMFALDDDRPVETNVFESKSAYRLIEELMLKANMTVARRIYEAFPDRALLRRHPVPIQRRLAAFAEKAKRLGFNISIQDSGSLQRGLLSIEDPDVRKAMETFVIKAMHRAKYCLSTIHNEDDSYFHHYALNVSIYTHFTSPIRRYADIAVHRQLEAALNGTDGEIHHEEADGLVKTIEILNNRTDCAHNAQEQSIHLFLCTMINNLTIQHGPVLRNSIVISVDPSSFDVLIPEFGVEKRVHLDQLPLVRAEWDDSRKILELHWQKGVDTSTYIPEDEKQAVSRVRSSSMINVEDDIQRKMMDIGSLTIEDETALFDGDDDGAIPEESQSQASTIHSNPSSKSPLAKLSTRATNLTDIFKATQRRARGNSIPPKPNDFMFNDTEERSDGTCVQYIRELSRVPVVVQADITNKSPPCLLIKAVNPWHPK